MKRFFIGLIVALIYCPKTISAQVRNDSVLQEINKEVSKVLSQNEVPRLVKDSIALYTYTISIKIRSSNKIELSVSNAVLYDYFPHLNQLEKVDFKPLGPNTTGSTLVIPIVIANQSGTAKNRYTRQEGKLLVDMELVAEELNSMLSNLMSKASERKNIKIILKPFTITIFNQHKN